jgi:putative tricarboxylic transport membrane protein
MTKDIVVGAVCLIGSILLFFSLEWIPDERAALFPKVILVIMITLSIFLLIYTFIIGKMPQEEGPPIPWMRLIVLFAFIIVYLSVMENLGFYVSGFLYLLAVTLTLDAKEITAKKAVTRVVVSGVFMAVMFVLFKIILKVQTPTGILI